MFEPRPGQFDSALPITALTGPTGFRSDVRFLTADDSLSGSARKGLADHEAHHEEQDPIALAFQEGFATGLEQAHAEAAETARIEAEARGKLDLSFARLDHDLSEELRLRLRDAVAALCEEAIAPFALDDKALLRRIDRAVEMLQRADDERIIRLHPDDIDMISDRFAADWQVVPDPSLERGALRVESTSGGVEDGPVQWRRAIAEALHQC